MTTPPTAAERPDDKSGQAAAHPVGLTPRAAAERPDATPTAAAEGAGGAPAIAERPAGLPAAEGPDGASAAAERLDAAPTTAERSHGASATTERPAGPSAAQRPGGRSFAAERRDASPGAAAEQAHGGSVAGEPAGPSAGGEGPDGASAVGERPGGPAVAAEGTGAVFPGAESLDALLGDPWRAGNPYGFAAAVARDGRAEFPHAFAERLESADLPLAHVPAGLGGTLTGLDDTLQRVRVAARRDAAVMPATLLSCAAVATVLAAGTPGQARAVADWVHAGRTVAFALSEEHAGSDVLANTCRLEEAPGGGFTLTGSKWMVGRGATAHAALVVARTAPRGPAAFTAVLLGPRELARVRRAAAHPVTGMRGIDFADLVFDGTPVPADAVVGAVGGGLAAAMRAQQLVRLLSTAACLATADTALRTALRFTRSRKAAGAAVAAAAHTERDIALAGAELMAADVLSLTAARYAQLSPGTFGLCSHVVKRVATRLTASSIARSRGLLGARGFLADGPGSVVDKAQRDNAVVESIDTSPLGVLRAVAAQLPAYAEPPQDAWTAPRDVRALCAYGEPLPALDHTALDLAARPRDRVLLGFAEHAATVAARLEECGAPRAAKLVREVRAALAATVAAAADARRDRAAGPEPLDLADSGCLLYAAAAAALAWWAHPGRGLYGERPDGAGWLTAVLAVLLAHADGRDPRRVPAGDLAPAAEAVTRLDADPQLFTALPVRLSDAPGPA
ncbi:MULTISPECIES: acyl-CoA dehydrogenase family protein [unclassified Streptomyces]|uniref:acyl-CoA dehydrogenase family protein n=1 Tax=unclassified Streptomyces TaxID=2593676 RepID=UPI0036F54C65